MRSRTARRSIATAVVGLCFAAAAPAAPPASASSATGPIEVRSLGTAAGGSISKGGVESITVPNVAPRKGRLVLLWVIHRRDATGPVQTIEDITHPAFRYSDWTKEFHSSDEVATRFALFWAITPQDGPNPPAGDLTVRFGSRSLRTLAIVLEAANVELDPSDGSPLTNVVSDEDFSGNPTSKTHYLQEFADRTNNATLAFQMAGANTTITPDPPMELVRSGVPGVSDAHVDNAPDLTTAAAYDRPDGQPSELWPRFTWTKSASSGGLALELRADGSAPAFPIQRHHLTQGRATGGSSVSTASISSAPDRILVALVANGVVKGGMTPGLPTVAGPDTTAWSRVESGVFDTVEVPRSRVTILVAPSGGSGPVSISFAQSQGGGIGWILAEFSGVDLSNGAEAAVRQAASAGANGVSAIETALEGFGSGRNAVLAAIGFDEGGEPVVERGYARAIRTATGGGSPISVGDLRLWAEWRGSAETTPSATLATLSDATMLAVELKAAREPQLPSVAGLSPATGSTAGGTEVEIDGTDLAGAVEVLFGTESATFSVVSSSQIIAMAPSQQAGTVSVRVRTGVGISDDTEADDFRYLPTASVGDATAGEDAGPAIFDVTLSGGPAPFPVTVGYSTVDDTARSSSDYTASSGTVEFAPGETATTVTVPIVDDAIDEPDEIFFVDLSTPNGATIADGRGQATLVDDDPTPSVSIGDVTVTEGNGGTPSAVFTVSLSGVSSTDVTVPYSTADGTATAGSDYTAASGTLAIPAGETSRTLTVPVTGDTVDEPDEIFFVDLSSPNGATIADGQGQGTITDDDEPPPPSTSPELSIGDASVLEGAPGTKTALRLTVTLSSPQASNVTFSYASVDHTATAASGDYLAKSGTGTIVAGATTTTVRVDVRGDAIDEPDEIFFVDLSSPNGATIVDGRGEGTIVDDDP